MKHTPHRKRYFGVGVLAVLTATAWLSILWRGPRVLAQNGAAPVPTAAPKSLLEGFRHVEVASVSDAAEQILGRKVYVCHRMKDEATRIPTPWRE